MATVEITPTPYKDISKSIVGISKIEDQTAQARHVLQEWL